MSIPCMYTYLNIVVCYMIEIQIVFNRGCYLNVLMSLGDSQQRVPFFSQFIHESVKNEDTSKKAPWQEDILTWSQKTRNFALLFINSVFFGCLS